MFWNLIGISFDLLSRNINSINGTLQVAPLAQTWFIRCRASHRGVAPGQAGRAAILPREMIFASISPGPKSLAQTVHIAMCYLSDFSLQAML